MKQGDIVTFKYRGYNFRSKIIRIENSTIIIQDVKNDTISSITKVGSALANKWLLPNGVEVMNVEFTKAPPTFEKFPELDLHPKKEILINASHNTFIELCITNKEMQKLCNDYPHSEEIYHERTKRLFPQYLHLKNNSIKWKKLYNAIIETLNGINQENNNNTRASSWFLWDALNSTTPLLYLQIFDVYNSEFISKLSTQKINQLAAHYEGGEFGTIATLNWLKSKGKLPNNEAFELAFMSDNIAVLNWFEENGIRVTFVSNDDYISIVRNGNLNVLKWLAEREIYPTTEAANNAVERNEYEILDWMMSPEIDIEPNVLGANFAAFRDNYRMLNYLEEHGILPDIRAARMAKNNREMLEWLGMRGIRPN